MQRCQNFWTGRNIYTSQFSKFKQNNFGLYRDDGLAVVKDMSGPQKLRKNCKYYLTL